MLIIKGIINDFNIIFQNAKKYPIKSIFLIIILLIFMPIGFSIILDIILPESCFQIHRDDWCPYYFRILQDYSLIFAYLISFILSIIIIGILKYIKLPTNKSMLTILLIIIYTVISYIIFSIYRSHILETSCYLNFWWLWWHSSYYCWRNYYLLNFHPLVLFWLIWFIWLKLIMLIFSKKIFNMQKNIFMSKNIIISYIIIMIIPISIMTLILVWSYFYRWNLTFKEVWQSGLTTFIYLNYFLVLIYTYILRNKSNKYIYLFSLLIALIELPIINFVLKSNHFYFF